MTLVAKLLALKTTPPFDRLSDAELTLIAAHARVREFAPGEMIHAGTAPFLHFLLLAQGGWSCPGQALTPTLGVGSLLFGLPSPGTVTADSASGAVCLVISKAHFHTIAHECPDLLLGYLLQEEASPA